MEGENRQVVVELTEANMTRLMKIVTLCHERITDLEARCKKYDTMFDLLETMTEDLNMVNQKMTKQVEEISDRSNEIAKILKEEK